MLLPENDFRQTGLVHIRFGVFGVVKLDMHKVVLTAVSPFVVFAKVSNPDWRRKGARKQFTRVQGHV